VGIDDGTRVGVGGRRVDAVYTSGVVKYFEFEYSKYLLAKK